MPEYRTVLYENLCRKPIGARQRFFTCENTIFRPQRMSENCYPATAFMSNSNGTYFARIASYCCLETGCKELSWASMP